MRREFEQEIARMQKGEDLRIRDMDKRIQLLEAERTDADERRMRAERAVNSMEQTLVEEREARSRAEQDAKRLAHLLDEQVTRTKSAVQGLLLQTGLSTS